MKKFLLISAISFSLVCSLELSQEAGIALLGAASDGRVNDINALLKAGANKNFIDDSGFTPLHAASSNGQVDAIKALIDAGADKEAIDHDYSFTPLFLAAANGHAHAVKALVDSGADKEARDYNNATPLCIASIKGHLDVIKALILAGADKSSIKDFKMISPEIASFVSWYNIDIADKEKTLFGQSVKKALDEYEKGKPELLAQMLGISIDKNQSMLSPIVVRQARNLFEPYNLEKNIIPDLEKKLQKLNKEANAQVAKRGRDRSNIELQHNYL